MNYCTGILILLLLLAGCRQKNGPEDTPGSGVIRIAVDAALAPVIDQEIAVFEALSPRAGIVPVYTGETEAVNLLLEDSVRLAVTTRGLTEEEFASFHSRKFFPQVIKIATDGIALIIHKDNPDSLINVEMLRKILIGEVDSWDELYPGSRLGKFQVVFDNPNSGTVRYMIDSVCGGGKFSEQCFAQPDNRKVVEYVKSTPSAIGIIGVNWISNPQDSLCVDFLNQVQVMRVGRTTDLTVRNSFQPYSYYLYTGQYPLTRNVYILLNDPRSGLASGLTSFITGARGQRIILKSGLLPATMPVNVVNVRE